MQTPDDVLEENRRLRRAMRDLVALSTLPAAWAGMAPDGVARGLADALLGTLSLELVYVRLTGLTGKEVEVARTIGRPDAPVEAVRAAVAPLLEFDRGEPPLTITDPSGGGTLRVAVTRFGAGGDRGVLVAGSSRADFPSEPDRLLLDAGASQAAAAVERGRAERRVAEQGERLRTTLASIGDGVVTTDTEGRVTNLNPVAESLTGWANADAVGRPLDAVFHIVNEETRNAVENPAARALREGVVVGLANHTVLIARDGTERPIDDSAAPIRSAAGEVVGCVLVFRDVTERRRAEGRLRSREAELTEAQRVAHVGSWHWDAATDATTGSDELYRIYGLDPAAGPFPDFGRQAGRLYPHESWRRINEAAQQAMRTGAGYELDVAAYRDGAPIWVTARGEVVRGGGGAPVGLRGTVQDITDRTAAAASLRESEANYRLIVEGNPLLICRFKADGTLTFVNEAYCRTFGKTREELVGRKFTPVIPDEDRPQIDRLMAKLAPDMAPLVSENRVVVPGGGVRWTEWTNKPVVDAGGRFIEYQSVGLDVTERKGAEERLRASEAFNRSLMDGSADCVKVLDLGGRLLAMNAPGLCAMEIDDFGPLCGREWSGLWPAETREAVDRAVASARGGGTSSFQAFCPTAKGTPRWWEVTVSPVRGTPGGPVVRVLGVSRDVTAHRRAEDAMRASEARNSFLVALADTLRPLSDPAAVRAEASRVLGERLGANRVVYFEILGDEYVIERDYAVGVQPLAGRYPVAAFGPALLAALLAGRTVVEADATGDPGRPPDERAAFAAIRVRGHVDVPLVKGGRFVAGMTVHVSAPRDWTPTEVAMVEDTAERTWAAVERVRAEEALRRSEERFRTAVAATSDILWTNDAAGEMVGPQPGWGGFTGQSPDEYRGYGWSAAVHPDDARPTIEAWGRAVAERRRFEFEHRVRRRDGAYRLCSIRAVPVVDGDGTLREWVGVHTDITEQRGLERALQEADRRKDEFLATLAHELRNPLAPIRNGLQIIRMAGAGGPVEQARAMMERQLSQMVRLVDDLLDVSRITRGKLDLRKERVELRRVVAAAVETSRPVLDQAGHTLTVAAPGGPVFVDGDAARLAQVLSNLLNNSAKYTRRGGNVRLTVGRDGGQAAVAVADDGIGIPPAMLGRVFDLFTQVDRTLEKTTGGLGIGLSLVKGLVEMHGGTVEARSEGEGKGSEFVVRLPVVTPPPAGADAPDGTANGALRGLRRVLVVDDNADAADSLGQLLGMLGNEVRTAYDGAAGAAAAGEFRPDVILMDIGMPKLNGYDAARLIRQQPWGRGVFMVALTGWGQDEDRRRSREAGFDGHLVKPVDADALEKLLAARRGAGG